MLVNAEALTVGLWVRLEAKPGRETDLDAFLRSAAPLAEAEPATPVWFALRLGPATFGVFDAFRNEAGREAHLAGRICRRAGGTRIESAGFSTGDRAGRRAGGKTAVALWSIFVRTVLACLAVAMGGVLTVASPSIARAPLPVERGVNKRYAAVAFDSFVLFNPGSVVSAVEPDCPWQGRGIHEVMADTTVRIQLVAVDRASLRRFLRNHQGCAPGTRRTR